MAKQQGLETLDSEKSQHELEKINEQLRELSKVIFPDYLYLAYIEIDALREQEVNARSMSKAMFSQLTENIANAGTLESVPFCAKVDDVVWIVSGHHRVRAARTAGKRYILVMVAEGLTWDQIRAKQLGHNSIEGQDDPELVKRIFEQIMDVQARFEAFIDPKLFDAAPKPVSFSPIDIDFQSTSRAVLLLFLPSQWDDMQAALKSILPPSDVDEALLADFKEWEPWSAALRQIRSGMDITAVPTAIATMAKLALERLEQLKDDGSED